MEINTNMRITPININLDMNLVHKQHEYSESKDKNNSNKVEELKKEIANGTYKINLNQLAEKIANELL